MDARAAERIKQIIDELLTSSIADLGDRTRTGRRLQDLKAAIDEVRRFAASIEVLLGGLDTTFASAQGPRPRGRPRRGAGDEFHATEFVLEAVKQGGKDGVRPRDIVERVVAAAPGRHVRPSALVSNLLRRLQAAGAVVKRGGTWYAK